jgi:hypothetical protein
VRRHRDGPVDSSKDVLLDEIALAQNSDRRAVPVEEGTMLGQLFELDLCHRHERVHLMLGALEVLDAERIDGYDLDAGFVADFEYLSGR